MSPRRGVWSRTLAALAILTVAASGSGLLMCVSLLARAAEPCAMHQHDRGSHDARGAQIGAAHDMDEACHTGDGNAGCAVGGSCPTGGTAGSVAPQPVLAAAGSALGAGPGIARPHVSFISPPLPPPPQA